MLNDLLTDDDREKLRHRFAEIVAPGGALLLDVRDWLKTVERYRDRTKTARAIELADRSHLTFQSETTLDPSTRQMIVSETFQFCGTGLTTIEQRTTEFRMRCWSASELQECFGPWFLDMDIHPDYVVPPAWTDRLVLVATRMRDVTGRFLAVAGHDALSTAISGLGPSRHFVALRNLVAIGA